MKNKNEIGIFLKKIFEENWNDVFIIDSVTDTKFTYGDFFKKITKFKEKITNLGVSRGDFLCLILDNSVDLAAIYFSSLLLGARTVPIDPLKGRDEIKEILSHFSNKKIICDEDSNARFFEGIHLNKLQVNSQENNNRDDLEKFTELNFDDTFLITFTSGSTGKQKGVMHSFNNLFQSAISFQQKFNFNKNNTFLHNLPMTYMAGILNLLVLPLVSLSKIVIGSRTNISNIATFWNTPIKYSTNTFWLIPTILDLLLKLDRGNNGATFTKNNNITICVGTSPLSVVTKKNFEEKYKVELFESYGLSETLFVSTNYLNYNKSSSVGKTLDGVEVKILADKELAIKAPWMFQGYFNLNNNDYLDDKFFLSGDLGEIDAENFLYIVGRKKDIIIKGGINLSPKKIEDMLNAMPEFNEVTVLGFPSKLLGEKTVCFCVTKKPLSMDNLKTINKKIVDSLGINYNIDEFINLDEIPKNLNGKVDKPKIRQMFSQKINDS
ncbi:MAG: class I adenylate-forming enzyme family protein [Thermoproteota archaeon]